MDDRNILQNRTRDIYNKKINKNNYRFISSLDYIPTEYNDN